MCDVQLTISGHNFAAGVTLEGLIIQVSIMLYRGDIWCSLNRVLTVSGKSE